MEEVAHAYYKHRPSQFLTSEDGTVRRVYDKKIEDEAYFTAAATLLSSKATSQAVWRGDCVEDIASMYDVSEDLVLFRVKTLRLWSQLTHKPAAKRRSRHE
jgi:Zn-dependent peptidase ImmA (M78 family)